MNNKFILLGSSNFKVLLNKYKNKYNLPFDNCILTLDSLINVLTNDFVNYSKLKYYNKININNKNKNVKDSNNCLYLDKVILNKYYNIEFNYLIGSNNNLLNYKNELKKSIYIFNLIIKNDKKKYFLRVELSNNNNNVDKYISKLFKLLYILELKCCEGFIVLLVVDDKLFYGIYDYIMNIRNEYVNYLDYKKTGLINNDILDVNSNEYLFINNLFMRKKYYNDKINFMTNKLNNNNELLNKLNNNYKAVNISLIRYNFLKKKMKIFKYISKYCILKSYTSFLEKSYI